MTVKFEGQDRRQAKLNKLLPEYGFKSIFGRSSGTL